MTDASRTLPAHDPLNIHVADQLDEVARLLEEQKAIRSHRTVVTAWTGRPKGQRIVRGRRHECDASYDRTGR